MDDELADFFDFSKPFTRVIVPGGYINGRQRNQDINVTEIKQRKMPNEDYLSSIHVDAGNRQNLENMGAAPSRSSSVNTLNQLEDLVLNEPVENPKKFMDKEDPIYKKYNFNKRRQNVDLPISDSKELILKMVRENRVVILEGDTGCGKTTQVPQYILDDAYSRKEYCNIVCTQPRRIAAISLSKRVCAERKWELGSVVGYQVGLHTTSSEDTRLLYCTAGVFLQKLIHLKDLKSYTHIILDEVHERTQDMDFILIIIKKLLSSYSQNNVKIILMSATIDTNEFSEYFQIPCGGGGGETLKPAPIIKVDTRRLYNVSEFYLCQLDKLQIKPDIINYSEPGITEEMYKVALKLVIICEKLDNQNEEITDSGQIPSILIFLPGINEIDKMEKTFETLHQFKTDITLVPMRLHSMISGDEQQRVFQSVDRNLRKVILATNIAESSITVPDVKYVIDFCLTKQIVTDTNTNLTSLQLNWAARSNCKQRAGRAGRVMNGRVYRLVSKRFYDEELREYDLPEMSRCPLENVVLKAKLLDMGKPHEILLKAMTPPNIADICNTILVLKETGALYQTDNEGNYDILDGNLTFIGRVMAALPIDVRITRLIIFGYIFSVLEETIIMAAGLNVQNIFEIPYNKKLKAYSQKVTWSDGSGSDLFAIWKAYGVWCSMKERNNFSSNEIEKLWARRYFINTRSLREVHLLVTEIKDRLKIVGLKEECGVNRINWTDEEKTIILKLVIAGAFYPNYFLRSSYDHHTIERDIYHSLYGLDPCNTVYFTGFDTKYLGQLYVEQIKNLFLQDADIQAKNIEISFSHMCQRVFITFLNDSNEHSRNNNNLCLSIPGRVKTDVYKAIKMRILRCSTKIRVMQPRDAILFAEKEKLGTLEHSNWLPRKRQINNPELIVSPSLYMKFVRGKVTHIENCNKFWFQPLSEVERLREITQNLNSLDSDLSNFISLSEISNGQIIAAPFNEIGDKFVYHRARCINIFELKNIVHCRVVFIDYGNYENIPYKDLRKFGTILTKKLNDLPPRIFECCLAEIQPSSIISPNGEWCADAMILMQSFIEKQIVEVEIFASVHNVCSCILRVENINFNELLIEKGFAQLSEENYMAKIDHEIRLRKQRTRENENVEDVTAGAADLLECVYKESSIYLKAAPIDKCKIRIDLKGPFSLLESKIYAATRVGGWKSVKMDPNSVNSILLDTDPQAGHETLVVAASVSENVTSNTIIARQTTLMPNIPGFAALMGLIFCPKMEIKRDAHKTKYTSFLAGLGFDKENEPIFEEHDIVFNLDIVITPDDIQKINQIRYSMDTLLNTDPGGDRPQVSQKDKTLLTGKIKYLVTELLKKSREYIEIHADMKDNIWNYQIDHDDLLVSNSIYEHRSIFPFHNGLRLYQDSFERIETLKEHCKELHDTAKFGFSIKLVLCQLCQINLEGIMQLRIHLFSQIHRDREKQIGYDFLDENY